MNPEERLWRAARSLAVYVGTKKAREKLREMVATFDEEEDRENRRALAIEEAWATAAANKGTEEELVYDMELSVRSINALHNGGIRTRGQLRNVSVEQLYRIPGFGKKSVHEILDHLNDSEKQAADRLLSNVDIARLSAKPRR